MKICSISGSGVWTSIHFWDINPGPAISQKLTHWDQHTLHLPPVHWRPQIWRNVLFSDSPFCHFSHLALPTSQNIVCYILCLILGPQCYIYLLWARSHHVPLCHYSRLQNRRWLKAVMHGSMGGPSPLPSVFSTNTSTLVHVNNLWSPPCHSASPSPRTSLYSEFCDDVEIRFHFICCFSLVLFSWDFTI